jgi:transposase
LTQWAEQVSVERWPVRTGSPTFHTVGDATALLNLIGQASSRAEAAFRQQVRVVCCYEVGYDNFSLYKIITAHGINNHVLDAASQLDNRRACRVRTDRIDVDGLIRVLAVLVRDERHACRAVHIPSVEDEDIQRQIHGRERAIAEGTADINRIKDLLKIRGVRDFMTLRLDAAEHLIDLTTADGRSLPPFLVAGIRRELWRLKLVEEMIGEVETDRDSVAAGTVTNQRITMPRQSKRIGPFATAMLGREVFHRQFTNCRELADYLAGRPARGRAAWASSTRASAMRRTRISKLGTG